MDHHFLISTLPDGRKLKNYVIQRTIGHGAAGATYLAACVDDGRKVAIREHMPAGILRRDAETAAVEVCDPSEEGKSKAVHAQGLFYNEALELKELCRENIVPVQEVFHEAGTTYYVMPFVEGAPLDEWAHSRTPLPRTTVAELLATLLETLDYMHYHYMHNHGVLHCDLSPRNIIMQEDGTPVLINFGMSRFSISCMVGSPFGTSGYTPYELRQSHGDIGPWSDIYALGAVFYRILAGTCPPDSADRTTQAKLYKPLVKNPDLVGRYGKTLLSCIDTALNMDATARWQNAAEWLYALQEDPSLFQPEAGAEGVSRTTVPTIRTEIRKENRTTSLMEAAARGEKETVRYLLNEGAPVDGRSGSKRTALLYAAEAGRTGVVELLLGRGADIDAGDNHGHTALMLTARNGCTETMLALLEYGADVDLGGNSGKTALIYAVQNGRLKAVKLLLEHGASLNTVDIYGHDVFWYAEHPNGYVPEQRMEGIRSLLYRRRSRMRSVRALWAVAVLAVATAVAVAVLCR